MNKAPAGGIDSQLVVRERPKAPQLDISPTREGVRDALENNRSLAAHPDAQVLLRALDAPMMLNKATLAQITQMGRGLGLPLALGALLPGCDGSTIVTVICGVFILLALGGGAAFATTLRLGRPSPKAWKLMQRDGIGGLLGLGDPVEAYSDKPFVYSTLFRREMAEVAKVHGNFPDQGRELDVAKKKVGVTDMDALMKAAPKLGLSSAFDAYLQPIEVNGAPIWFTWSVGTEIVEPVKSHILFDPSGDYALQSRKLNDEIQPLVAETISSFKFTDMDDATAKRAEVAKKLNSHAALKEFQDKYGIKLVIKLGDIGSPDELQQAATRKLVELKHLETDDIAVKRAEKKGEAVVKEAEARAEAVRILGEKTNAVFERKIEAANRAASPLVGCVAFATSELGPTLASLLANLNKGEKSDSGSK